MISIKPNYNLLKHNTFGLQATCDYFVEYSSLEDLLEYLNINKDCDIQYFHIGEGSNLVFTKDYEGVVLHSAILGKEVSEEENFVEIRVGAGENWDNFVAWCVENGYYGIENLSLIPGEVGAAAVQNIGAYGVEVADFITYVNAVNLNSLQIERFGVEECNYGYRESIFKSEFKGQYIITHVGFRLNKLFQPNLSYAALKSILNAKGVNHPTAQQLRDLIIEVRKDKLPDPKELGSAGSFFMNPVVSMPQFQQLKERFPSIPHYIGDTGVKIPAGWLIEQCGWKGRRKGAVGVYEKQALVLVNHGGATGADVQEFAELIIKDVAEKFDVVLRPEANFI